MEKDELDDFLYGNEEPNEQEKVTESKSKDQPEQKINHQAEEVSGHAGSSNEDVSEEEEDEDEDDDLEIVLDDSGNDIVQQPMQDRRKREAVQLVTSADGGNGETQTLHMQQQQQLEKNKYGDAIPLQSHHINVNAIGEHEGRSILEIELDTIEEKAWRQPGADLTDYFNYGFDENTWRAYCIKQKQLREEVNTGSLGAVSVSPNQPLFDVSIPAPQHHGQQQQYPPQHDYPPQHQQQYGNDSYYQQQQQQNGSSRDHRRRRERSRSPPSQRRYRSRSREDHHRPRARRY